jgi:glycosyltransferase involved in cell wall biosynthesis
MMPRLTFAVPVFNGERYLADALESILAQTAGDFELLIGDNASTDGTLRICETLASRDERIRIVRSEMNRGAAWNYNRLVELAGGEFFKWHPHDDLLAPPFAARCLERLQAHPDEVLCYPGTQVINERGEATHDDPDDALPVRHPNPAGRLSEYFRASFQHRSCNAVLGIIRTSTLRQTRLIGSYAGSDKVLLAELALLGRFHQLPETLFFRRAHEGSSVAATPDPSLRDRWFDTSARRKGHFVHWKWFAEYVRAIHHVPLSLPERLRAERVMLEYWGLHKPRLKQELKGFLIR